jgi:hypothetical protein
MMENYRMASLYARAFSGGAEMFAGVCSTFCSYPKGGAFTTKLNLKN